MWIRIFQAAVFIRPRLAGYDRPLTIKADPFSVRHFFDALSISLNTMARQAAREPDPLVLRCRRRTVANALSIGLVVRT